VSIKQEINRHIEGGNISEKDLMVFKIPITLPYQSDRDVERVKGNFEYEGRFYEMVKKQLKNDTLYVYCINNLAQERLKADLSKHTATQLGNTKDSTSQQTTEKIIKQVIKDYFSQTGDIFSAHSLHSSFLTPTSFFLPYISSSYFQVPSPPPKFS